MKFFPGKKEFGMTAIDNLGSKITSIVSQRSVKVEKFPKTNKSAEWNKYSSTPHSFAQVI